MFMSKAPSNTASELTFVIFLYHSSPIHVSIPTDIIPSMPLFLKLPLHLLCP